MMEFTTNSKSIQLEATTTEVEREVWQTEALSMQIKSCGIRQNGFIHQLGMTKDVTEENLHLARKFQPKITLIGYRLRGERHGDNFGGMYYRVLESLEDENQLVIQWLFVWIKQRFLISLVGHILPLLFLAGLVSWMFNYLPFETAVLTSVVISGILYSIDFFRASQFYEDSGSMAQRDRAVSDKISSGISLIFSMSIIEITLDLPRSLYFFYIDPPVFGFFQTILPPDRIYIPFVGLFFLYIGISTLLFKFFQRVIPEEFTHPTFEMDWEPLFIYLRDRGPGWEIEFIRYRSVQNYCITASFDGQPSLEITSKQHNFRLKTTRNPWYRVIGGAIVLIVATISINPSISLTVEDFPFLPFIQLINIVFFLIGIHLIYNMWPTLLIDSRVDLEDDMFHLTDNRLKIFWNLLSADARLKFHQKLQNPFLLDEDFHTFNDDPELRIQHLTERVKTLELEKFFKHL